MDAERLELIKLREEIERELGIKFTTDEKDFDLNEDLVISQVRSSIAGHGSGAHHSFLKQAKIEDERLKKMRDEWDRAVYRLQKLKEQRARDEEDKKAREKLAQQRKKAKAKAKEKKKKGGDSSESDLDVVSLFAQTDVSPASQPSQVQTNRTAEATQVTTNDKQDDLRVEEITGTKRKAETQLEEVDQTSISLENIGTPREKTI